MGNSQQKNEYCLLNQKNYLKYLNTNDKGKEESISNKKEESISN